MAVTLEALAAKEGDALLVRFGPDDAPQLWVIDAGPSGVYGAAVRPRLQRLRDERGLDGDTSLPIDLLVVSHVDSDHVRGVLDMFGDLSDAETRQVPAPYEVRKLWHNSFDVLAADPAVDAISASLHAGLARVSEEPPDDFVARAASIGEGRRLADLAHRFGLADNKPFDGLVMAPRQTDDGLGGASVTVVGPTRKRLERLADKWEKKVGQAIDRGDLAEAAAYVDTSVTNLSSIVLHVVVGARRLLLTGDARGDHLLQGLGEAGLLDAGGSCQVDLLKVPHHGSDRNLEKEVFERIVADHYVISADGKHDNPSLEVLDWIVDTQGSRDYEIHLTYGDAMGAAEHLRDRHVAGKNYVVRTRDPLALATAVHL